MSAGPPDGAAGGAGRAERRHLRVADLDLDLDALRVRVGDGRYHPLPPKEFDLLRLLMENAGRIVTRAEIADRLWVGDTSPANTIEVHVLRLRRRLDADPLAASSIRTVRGVGYVIDVE